MPYFGFLTFIRRIHCTFVRQRFGDCLLRAIAGYTSTLKYFLNSLHAACFMHGLSVSEIKRICPHARFFIISHGSFQHFTNVLKKTKTFATYSPADKQEDQACLRC